MGTVTVKLNKNYSKLALNLMHSQVERALEKCGLLAEGYAQVKLTEQDAVDTGNLRNSINHKVVTNKNEHSVYVGTNVEYAPYIEFGTGKYYPGGRKTPWFYKDSDGNWHKTSGMEARPYLRPAISDHQKEYIEIIKDELRS